MIYPTAVVAIAGAVVAAILWKVIPTFASLFAGLGAELPLPTRILVGVSDTLRNPFVLLPLITAIVVGSVLYRRNRRSERIRRIVEPLRFRLPVFGPLFAKVALGTGAASGSSCALPAARAISASPASL